MQRYESYKSSSIPWIDELPQHWGEEKGKWLHRFRKDANNRKQCDNVLSLTLRGVVNNDPDDPEGLVPKDYGTYQIFEKDDLVFKLIDLENFRTSRVGLVHERGIMSPAYLRIQPGKEHNPRYCYYYYFTLYQQGIYNKLGAGVRSTLGSTDLLEIGAPVPSKEEQDRIVTFLDQKTAEIDAAIAMKERLIELLDEQKSILINSLVTKGVNRQVVTKASGLSWGGDIPAHWKIRYLKHLFRETDSRTSTGEEPLFSLRMSGQLLRHNDVSDKPITPDQLIGYKIVSPGQLVMNRMRASMGLFAVAHERGLVSPDYAVFDCIDDISQAYFLALFRNSAIRGVFLTESKGLGTGSSGFLRLYSDRFGGIKVPCPPREEQEKIVLAINDHFIKFADVKRSVKTEIEKLTLMRTTLIADAVTGKMRV